MFWKLKLFILWSLWAARLVRQPTVVRRLQSGALLRGQVSVDGSHEKYLSIPYATVPNRFQAPGPEPVWKGIYEAVDENIRCPQPIGPFTTGQRDCLILNVYVPLPESTEPLPVMVFIHGGGFREGFGTQILYGPDYLVRHGVILVTLNYRLNIDGFLCLGIKEAPGNVGLKDQVAALKWVQRNIKAFGGDPDNVTIFGESAGGTSVSYHMLSPMSKGLFKKAIVQSGSSLAPWARQMNPIGLASSVAKSLGYDTENPKEIHDILMGKELFEIIVNKIPKHLDVLAINQDFPFVPCVEVPNEDAFLTDTPFNIYRNGNYNKVPVISGFTDKEGHFLTSFDYIEDIPNKKLEKSLPLTLNFTNELERQKLADDLSTMYLKGQPLTLENVLELSELLGDSHFKSPVILEANYLLKSSGMPVYSYIFKYDGWRNVVKKILQAPFRTAPGATHADDLFYLFNIFIFPMIYETETINRMTTMWTNFAKYGNPTPSPWKVQWHQTSRENPVALIIDSGDLKMDLITNHRPREIEFWKSVYTRYGK